MTTDDAGRSRDPGMGRATKLGTKLGKELDELYNGYAGATNVPPARIAAPPGSKGSDASECSRRDVVAAYVRAVNAAVGREDLPTVEALVAEAADRLGRAVTPVTTAPRALRLASARWCGRLGAPFRRAG